MRHRLPLAAVVLLLLPVLAAPAAAQTRQSKPTDELFKTLESLDAQVFSAYNTCDLDKFASLFDDDVEFYHDRGGLSRGKKELVTAVKNNICGKVRRDLVQGSMEVHPMNNYGALQIGSHRFCKAAEAKCEPNTSGIARFIHLWQQKDGVWKITRVLSYDHVDSK